MPFPTLALAVAVAPLARAAAPMLIEPLFASEAEAVALPVLVKTVVTVPYGPGAPTSAVTVPALALADWNTPVPT